MKWVRRAGGVILAPVITLWLLFWAFRGRASMLDAGVLAAHWFGVVPAIRWIAECLVRIRDRCAAFRVVAAVVALAAKDFIGARRYATIPTTEHSSAAALLRHIRIATGMVCMVAGRPSAVTPEELGGDAIVFVECDADPEAADLVSQYFDNVRILSSSKHRQRLGKRKKPSGGPPGVQALNDGRACTVDPIDIDEKSFVLSEAFAQEFVAALAALPMDRDIQALFRRYSSALVFALKHELARVFADLLLLEQIRSEAPATPLVIVQGAQSPLAPVFFFEDVSGRVLVTSGMATAGGMSRFAEALSAFGAAAVRTADADDGAQWLTRTVAKHARATRLGSPEGDAMIIADLRNPKDFRYRPAALSIVAAAARRRRVTIVQPCRSLGSNLLCAARAAWRVAAGFGRVVIRPVKRPVAACPRQRGRVAWTRLAGTAFDVTRSRWANQDGRSGQAECMRHACLDFASTHLPTMLGMAKAVETTFQRAAPAYLVVCPGQRPLSRITAIAARRCGVLVADVQTLMVYDSPRYDPPVADIVSVVDTSQKELLARHFGIDEGSILVAGVDDARVAPGNPNRCSQEVDRPRRGLGAQPCGAIITFFTQPLGTDCLDVVQALASICARHPRLRLVIKPHPDETAHAIDFYTQAVGEAGLDRFDVVKSTDNASLITKSDIVVTLFSNTGILAAAMGKPVIVPKFPKKRYPLSFDEMGLALAADDPASLDEVIADVLQDGPQKRGLEESRNAYFAANPQLFKKGLGDRVVSYLESCLASHRVGAVSMPEPNPEPG